MTAWALTCCRFVCLGKEVEIWACSGKKQMWAPQLPHIPTWEPKDTIWEEKNEYFVARKISALMLPHFFLRSQSHVIDRCAAGRVGQSLRNSP